MFWSLNFIVFTQNTGEIIWFWKSFVQKEHGGKWKESQGNHRNRVQFLSCSLLELHSFSVSLEAEFSWVLTAQMVLPHIAAFLHHWASREFYHQCCQLAPTLTQQLDHSTLNHRDAEKKRCDDDEDDNEDDCLIQMTLKVWAIHFGTDGHFVPNPFEKNKCTAKKENVWNRIKD